MADEARIDEAQAEASEIGHLLLILSQYDLSGIREGLSEELSALARDLHLIETAELYIDGGLSLRKILERIETGNSRLEEIVQGIE